MRRDPVPCHRPKVRDDVRRMTYSQGPYCPFAARIRLPRARAGALRSGPRSARLVRADHEDRAAPETLRRGPVAEDQLPDRPATARVPIFEEVGFAGERAAAGLDLDRRIDEEIGRPRAVERAGRDEDRAVRLVDVSDGDGAPLPAPPAAGPDAGEPGVEGEGVVECRNPLRAARGPGRSRPAVAGRQRLRCQDLPSVATDGA
jgi:hypothetical protein